MARYENTCDGTDGSAVTTSSSDGSSTQFTVVTGAPVYDTGIRVLGASSIECSDPGGGTARYMRLGNLPSSTQVAARAYIRFDAVPTGGTRCFELLGSSGVRVLSVVVSTGMLVQTTDNGGTFTTSSASLSAGVWYRFEAVVDVTAGTIRVNVYEGGTMDVAASVVPATVTSNNVPIIHLDTGKITASAGAVVRVDGIAVETGGTAEIGPPPAATASYQLSESFKPSSTERIWVVDATSSSADTTLVQVAGVTATVIESPADVYSITPNGGYDDLVFKLTAGGAGASGEQTIRIARTSDASPYPKPFWVLQGGDPSDMKNWA